MAPPNQVLSAPLTSSAAVFKNLLTITGCVVGLLLMLVTVALLLYPLLKVRKAKFGIKPFVVAPELDSKIGVVIEAAVRAELHRAAVLKARIFRTSHEANKDGIEIETTVLKSRVGMSKPSVSYGDQTDNDLHDVLRGVQHAGFNPVVRRLKEIKFEVDDKTEFDQEYAVESNNKTIDITDAVTIDGGSTKILPVKILMKLLDWKIKRYEFEVFCAVRHVNGCLRVTATVVPKPVPAVRRWISGLRQQIQAAGQRLPWLRRVAKNLVAAGLQLLEPQPPLPSKRVVYECSVGLASSTDIDAQAAMIGVELAQKLLVGKQNAEWQALKHYIDAITTYDRGLSLGDPTLLRQAVDHAGKALGITLGITPELVNLPSLMIATSDVLSTFYELDAAEQALRVILVYGLSPHGVTDGKEDEAKLLQLRTLARLGIICYQKGEYLAGQSALRQARKLTTQDDYIKLRIYPVLAANLSRMQDNNSKKEAVKLLILYLSYYKKSDPCTKWLNLGDQLGKVSLHDLALKAYNKSKKSMPSSSYLLWRCGVIRIYLVMDWLESKEVMDWLESKDQHSTPEEDKRRKQNRRVAIKHLQQGKKELVSASCGIERTVLPPDRKRRLHADPEADVWCKLGALSDLALMSSFVGMRSAQNSGTRAITRARRFHKEAQEHIERAADFAPNEWDIQYNRGLILQRWLETEGKDPGERDDTYEDVKYAYKTAIRLAPTEVIPHLAIATLLDQEGAHEAARSHFELARINTIARRNFDVRAIATLCAQGQARVLEKLTRFDEAVGVLQAQVASDSCTPELWQYLGFLKLKQAMSAGVHDYDQALQDIRRSRDIAASTAARPGTKLAERTKAVMQFASELEGTLHRWAGRPRIAELHFMHCQDLSEYACASLSAIAHTFGDYDAAEKWAEKAQKLRREREREAEARSGAPKAETYYRACIAAMSGATEEAFSKLQEALLWQPALGSWARLDPDLGRVAGHTRFKALITSRKSAA